jgi:intracellular sulfur oxidation DsrE/DsrF family protein
MQMAASHCHATQLRGIEQETVQGRCVMIKFENTVGAAIGIVALLMLAPSSTAETAKNPIRAQMVAPPSAAAPLTKQTTAQKQTVADKKLHNLVLQVNTNEPAMMNLALNNATNVAQYYKDLGEKVSIEVVTFGPGLHMLRDDTSPVKARIEVLALSTPEISFKACGNTQENMRKAESKDIPIIPQAQVVKSGVVRVMELQEKGWSYVKP